LRKIEAHRRADGAVCRLHLPQDPGVIGGIGHDRDVRVILGRASHHRWAADIDVLDRLL
jgi:hypothetical protein